MTGDYRIEKLQRTHDVDGLECVSEHLHHFLGRYSFQNQKAAASQTYVGLSAAGLVGYYTLVVGEIAYDQAVDRLKKGLARHPVPVMVIARLAVATAS